ncbi:MMPL family transporter (plasmid) [Streptomyces sp. BI20]|uniref:MMPL family transporter n=1 Tax=Streptomyces sp. BI20 TaxID=3403460 RepID=UPI003C719B3E
MPAPQPVPPPPVPPPPAPVPPAPVPPASAPIGAPPRPPGVLHRLGALCARRAGTVVLVWLLVLLAAGAGRIALGADYSDEVSLPGGDTAAGAALLARSAPELAAPGGTVVLHAPRGRLDAHDRDRALAETRDRLADLPHVTAVAPLRTAADGATGLVALSFDRSTRALGHGYTADLDRATAPARAAGLEVGYGGDLQDVVRTPPAGHTAEAVGLAAALLVLLLAFGSVLGALLPLVTALIAVGVGMGVVGITAGVITLATSAPTLATMIGLGVGVDYALFLVTRFRQDLIDGHEPREAVARTVGTGGRAVLVAAVTVAVALLALYVSGLTLIGRIGLAAALALLVTAASALTLVPAALALVGRRVDGARVRRRLVAESSGDHDGWHRHAARVARRPLVHLLAGLALLAVCAVPVLSLRLGHVDAGADPLGSPGRTAHDRIAAAPGPGFGPGANGPLTVVVDLAHARTPTDRVAHDLAAALAGAPHVAHVAPPTTTPDGLALVTTVLPTTGPADAATAALRDTLTEHTLPEALAGTGAVAHLTGSTAGQLEFRDTVTARLPVLIGVVLLAAFLLLTVVFRSLVIPLKAVALNLLTTAASYGVLVAVFSWGWGSGLLGLDGPVPIESWVPMMMFAIVFGLSMDYEIFLLSRIAEARHAGADTVRAVSTGLALTGRVITSAAVVMTAVFLAFTTSPTPVVKMLALGLAVSVVLDATVVRLVLVPASMFLMGRANWWLPAGLARRLPRLDL